MENEIKTAEQMEAYLVEKHEIDETQPMVKHATLVTTEYSADDGEPERYMFLVEFVDGSRELWYAYDGGEDGWMAFEVSDMSCR